MSMSTPTFGSSSSGLATANQPSLTTVVFGKSILAGEHAVLRGCPAIVFPVYARSLTLRYVESDQPMSVSFSGKHGDEMRLLFSGVVERAGEMTGLRREAIRGHFEIENEIPVGAGMGASAALSVAVGRWFAFKNRVSIDELHEFCRQLENLFHGESSGLDIAVCIEGRALRFVRGGERSPITVGWKPHWFVSYSGQRGLTAECVSRVKALIERDPSLGAKIDAQMCEAVVLAEAALVNETPENFSKLTRAIELACACFVQWDLTKGEIGTHMDWLRSKGAVAVKPTGSGEGGFVLSLWRTEPPADVLSRLISLNP